MRWTFKSYNGYAKYFKAVESVESNPGREIYHFQDCFLALFIIFPNYIIKEIESIQEHFLLKHSHPKLNIEPSE